MHLRSISGWLATALVAVPCLLACSDPEAPAIHPPPDAGHSMEPPVADAGTAMDGGSTDAPIPDGDPGEQETDLEFPNPFDIGAVPCGGTGTGNFELVNRGPNRANFFFSSEDPAVVIRPLLGNVDVDATKTVTVTVQVPMQSAARAEFVVTLKMTSNARQGHRLLIPTTFRAHGAELEISPSAIAFGDTPVLTTAARSFTVHNRGDAAATVTIVAPPGELGIQLGDSGDATTVEPGATATGEARYLPADVGADQAQASTTVVGAVCGVKPPAISLSGQGVAPGDAIVVGLPPRSDYTAAYPSEE